MTDARALLVERPGDVRVVDAGRGGGVAHGEVIVRVAYAGICGSDREVVAGTRDRGFVRYPVVLGHEWSGTVEEVGPGVDGALVGHKVVGEGFWYCGSCSACRAGDTNLCMAGYDETGFTRPGACADWLRVPARLLHVLPDEADLRAATLLEPASCMAAAVLAAQVVPGERVAVVGGGTLGLLATQLIAAASPAELVVVDPRPRSAATAAGATDLVKPERMGQLWGRVDGVREAAGARGTGRAAVRLTRRGGRAVLAGLYGGADEAIPPSELVASAVTVRTVFGAPSRAWTHAVRAFATGLLRPLPLVSDEYLLEDATHVLGPDATLPTGKVLLHP
jgi:threonine dehydrogenase-like Zn-dependent dehydrogenase